MRLRGKFWSIIVYEYNCKIVRVVDGDTVDVDIDLGFGIWRHKERIRLHGIDTPESRTRDLVEKKFGFQSKEMVDSYLPVGSNQKLVTVKDGAGKFGRILGKFKIYDAKVDRETTLNEWMIENLINYKKVFEELDITESELDTYINSKS